MTTAAILVPASAALADPGVAPKLHEQTLQPGDSTTITKTVTTPEILPKPDIYFLADTTGSMDGAIANVKANATTIMNEVSAASPSAQFGAGQYKDFPTPATAYNNDASIGPSAAAQAGIDTWGASGGGDTPEANLYALHRLVTDAGFRADSSRIVVWFGDAPGHDPICSTVSLEAAEINQASVTAELKAAGIKVIAVSVAGGGGGLIADPGTSGYPLCPGTGSAGQANEIAAATGGASFNDVPADQVSAKIKEGLTALPVTVTPSATCDAGVTATFDPAELTVTSGSDAVFQETLTVAGDATAGAKTCTVKFLLNGEDAGDAFTQTVRITVTRPDCTLATVTPSSLWPPNHKFQTVTVTVPETTADPVTTSITGVTQDEALDGLADGNTSPDAAWVTGHPNQVQVRAERSGAGDGRVYTIAFTATDGSTTCSGTVTVGVPHDQSGPAAVNTVPVAVNSFG